MGIWDVADIKWQSVRRLNEALVRAFFGRCCPGAAGTNGGWGTNGNVLLLRLFNNSSAQYSTLDCAPLAAEPRILLA